MAWKILLGTGVALVVAWSALVAFLMVSRPSARGLREGLIVLPDTVRLLRRLVFDPATPRGVRLRIGLLLAYLATPIDLVPDFLPVIGYADDVIIVIAVVRSVIRHAGRAAVCEKWPGSACGLAVLLRLAGLEEGPARPEDSTGIPAV